MKNKIKHEKNGISWEGLALGGLLLLAGSMTLFKGIHAYKFGELIPPTGKSSWMTGTQAIIVSAIMILTGAGFLLNEAFKAYTRNQQTKV